MKILFLTQIVPFPPDAGPKVKTWHVLRALIGQGHSVTLVSFVRPEEEQYLSTLKNICEAVHAVPIRRSRVADVGYMIRSYLTTRPFLIERDDLRPMQKLVNDLVRAGDFRFLFDCRFLRFARLILRDVAVDIVHLNRYGFIVL